VDGVVSRFNIHVEAPVGVESDEEGHRFVTHDVEVREDDVEKDSRGRKSAEALAEAAKV